MKLAAALLLALAVALMGGARTAGAWPAAHGAPAAHHAGASHHHAHDHRADHHHAHHRHAHAHAQQTSDCAPGLSADERSDDGPRHSTCCAFACHAIAAQAASALVFPARAANGLSPADAPLLRGGAPPGFDRPPRLA
jgi:hypothetical protein